MNVYEAKTVGEQLGGNSYAGRGIIIGKTESGKAVTAYFIMGRSENSRNRIFEIDDKGQVFTKPFDESKVEDPSLIIYRAVAPVDNYLIVTNGDQTDTIADGLAAGKTARESLLKREFEPDAPNFTPRISGVITFEDDGFSYEISILKSADQEGNACSRFFFEYPAIGGIGHLIHTYEQDGNPLPTFCGEPRRIIITEDIEAFADEIWNSLNEENKISLYVMYADFSKGIVDTKLINKNGQR
ncbi:MAG: IMP cyclohydrolase [Anaerovoracaceae bacterium]